MFKINKHKPMIATSFHPTRRPIRLVPDFFKEMGVASNESVRLESNDDLEDTSVTFVNNDQLHLPTFFRYREIDLHLKLLLYKDRVWWPYSVWNRKSLSDKDTCTSAIEDKRYLVCSASIDAKFSLHFTAEILLAEVRRIL